MKPQRGKYQIGEWGLRTEPWGRYHTLFINYGVVDTKNRLMGCRLMVREEKQTDGSIVIESDIHPTRSGLPFGAITKRKPHETVEEAKASLMVRAGKSYGRVLKGCKDGVYQNT